MHNKTIMTLENLWNSLNYPSWNVQFRGHFWWSQVGTWKIQFLPNYHETHYVANCILNSKIYRSVIGRLSESPSPNTFTLWWTRVTDARLLSDLTPSRLTLNNISSEVQMQHKQSESLLELLGHLWPAGSTSAVMPLVFDMITMPHWAPLWEAYWDLLSVGLNLITN